jgi:hypothetical protein
MGRPGTFLSEIAFIAGAIMYWALTPHAMSVAQSHGFRLATVGVILMVAGGLGLVAAAAVFAVSRLPRMLRTMTTDLRRWSPAMHQPRLTKTPNGRFVESDSGSLHLR